MSGWFEIVQPELLKHPYTLVVLGALLIAIQLIVFMYIYVLKNRIKIFNGKFMKKFEEKHKEAFGTKPANLGYPDTGNGRYSKELSYKDWYIFNCAQRCHLNYIEGFALIVLGTLISGIQYPLLAFATQMLYIVGRQLYSDGYMKGADYRITGAGLYQVANLAAIVMSVKSALSIVG